MPKKDVRLAKWRDILWQEKLYREAIGLGLELIANSPRLHNGVTAAFKYFGLDAKSPLHIKILLGSSLMSVFRAGAIKRRDGMIITTWTSHGALKSLLGNTKG